MEAVLLLLCYKAKHRDTFFMLRGNHECAAINRIYGFCDECKRAYGLKIWKQFNDVFNCMPVAAVVDDKIFCVHGGLSPELRTFDQITSLRRPTDVPDAGMMCDFLCTSLPPRAAQRGAGLRGGGACAPPPWCGPLVNGPRQEGRLQTSCSSTRLAQAGRGIAGRGERTS